MSNPNGYGNLYYYILPQYEIRWDTVRLNGVTKILKNRLDTHSISSEMDYIFVMSFVRQHGVYIAFKTY